MMVGLSGLILFIAVIAAIVAVVLVIANRYRPRLRGFDVLPPREPRDDEKRK